MIQNRSEACHILGIPINSSIDVANQQYRFLVKQLRPDLNDNIEDIQKFLKIKEAISYIRENDYPIFPVEIVLNPKEKLEKKINIHFHMFKNKIYKLEKKIFDKSILKSTKNLIKQRKSVKIKAW